MGEFPNKATQFKPGQSGNLKGRPKGTSLTDKLRKILEREGASGKQISEALMEAGVKAALEGDFRFWREIIDRIDGPVGSDKPDDEPGGLVIRFPTGGPADADA